MERLKKTKGEKQNEEKSYRESIEDDVKRLENTNLEAQESADINGRLTENRQ